MTDKQRFASVWDALEDTPGALRVVNS